MRVAFLNPSGQIGGAERSLLDVLASLREARPAWSLHLVASANGPLLSAARDLGVRAEALPFPRSVARLGDGGHGGGSRIGRAAGLGLRLASAAPGVIDYVRRLRRLLAELAPDVVHSNGFKMHLLGAWAKPPGAALVWHVHDFVGRRPVMRAAMRRAVGGCSAVIANSQSVATDVRGVVGDAKPIRMVYNAVDLERFSPYGEVAELPEPGAGEAVRVGLVATLGWWKGHETFLRAISLVPRSVPLHAYVVGGPLYETDASQLTIDRLHEVADGLEIADLVSFTGYVAEIPDAMRALDIVVHASTEPEPFGLVIAEAMACGRAVVASTGGGAAELVKERENALGHPPGDAERLAEAIARLAADPELRERLGRAARLYAERHFDRRRLATEIEPVYEEAARRGRP